MRVNGQAIRAARDEKGLSRELLAERVRQRDEDGPGVSSGTIERIERGLGDGVSASTLYLISRELDVDIDSLFTEETVA